MSLVLITRSITRGMRVCEPVRAGCLPAGLKLALSCTVDECAACDPLKALQVRYLLSSEGL